MKILNCKQGSPEWLQARCGKITASMFGAICKRLKSGEFSSECHKYAFRLACERISGQLLDDDQFETYAMRRGRELEPIARYVHEQRIGEKVEQLGFIATDDDLFGASLDGIIGDDGASEYKCFMSPSSLMPILLNDDISDIEHQAQGGMWISGRKWIDVCLYCPSLCDVDLDFSSFRVHRDDNFIEKMESELITFNDLVESYILKLKSKRGFV